MYNHLDMHPFYMWNFDKIVIIKSIMNYETYVTNNYSVKCYNIENFKFKFKTKETEGIVFLAKQE